MWIIEERLVPAVMSCGGWIIIKNIVLRRNMGWSKVCDADHKTGPGRAVCTPSPSASVFDAFNWIFSEFQSCCLQSSPAFVCIIKSACYTLAGIPSLCKYTVITLHRLLFIFGLVSFYNSYKRRIINLF